MLKPVKTSARWLSPRHPCRFSNGYISLSKQKHLRLSFLHCWKNVKKYNYAKFQAAPGLFSSQNRRGLNRPILRPLWLMMSATNGSSVSPLWYMLTHWGSHKMATILRLTFSHAFYWMKIISFLFEFPWNMNSGVQLLIYQHWFRWWLGADQATGHYLNQWWPSLLRIHASLGYLVIASPFFRICPIYCHWD